jgi:ribosomal protein L16 Arg81 hydroxylase
MELREIDRRSGLSAREFQEEYLKKNKPVIFTDLTKDWEALDKWNLDYFINDYGHLECPIFSSNYSKPGKGYMTHDQMMRFDEFLTKTAKGNTDLRLFLYDIFKSAPELRDDFKFPTVMNGFIKSFPLMFFGGEGAEVTMHYDIDCANVFLTQFAGNKRVILFAPEESEKLYHHPFTVKSLVDPKKPDLHKFPALNSVVGYDTILKHGETIFMPSQYWHYMHYLDFSFGLALRSQNSVFSTLRGGANIAAHYLIDRSMNLLLGNSWHDWKEKKAYENARPYEGLETATTL